jgi:hypothetical protein
VLAVSGVLFLALGALAIEYPRAIGWPFAVVAIWIAVTVWFRALRLYRRRHSTSHTREEP